MSEPAQSTTRQTGIRSAYADPSVQAVGEVEGFLREFGYSTTLEYLLNDSSNAFEMSDQLLSLAERAGAGSAAAQLAWAYYEKSGVASANAAISTLTSFGDLSPPKVYDVPFAHDYGNTSVSAYDPSWGSEAWSDIKTAFSTATAPGYQLRNEAYDDLSMGHYGSGGIKYLGSLLLRSAATMGTPIDIAISSARGHGLQPTPGDRQDSAIIQLVVGSFVGRAGSVRAADNQAANVMRYTGRRMDVRAKFVDSPSAQATSPGHSFASRREAYQLALDPEIERVTMNAGYNRLLRLDPGTISPNVRPDVGALHFDGRVARTEVMSASDNADALLARNTQLDIQLRNNNFNPLPPQVISPRIR